MRRILLGLTLVAMGCFRAAGAGDLFPCDAGLCHADGAPAPEDGGAVDAGPEDGGVADAGALDAGAEDGGAPDAGPTDGGVADAGSPDAGPAPEDGGAVDAGPPDAGSGPADAGAPDAGLPPPPIDAGPADAGPAACDEAACAAGTHCLGGSCQAPAPLPLGVADPAVAVGPGGLVYVLGGNGPQGPTTATQLYDPRSNQWTDGGSLRVPLVAARAALGSNGNLYVVGGQMGSNSYGTVWIYYPSKQVWSTGASMPVHPTGDFVLGADPDGARLYAAVPSDGGLDVAIYDVDGGGWTDMGLQGGSAPAPTEAAGALVGGNLVVAGGALGAAGSSQPGTPQSQVAGYDVASTPPTPVTEPSLPWPIEEAGGGLGRDGRLYLVGGFSSGGNPPATPVAFDGSQWFQIPSPTTNGAPPVSFAAVAATPLAPDLVFLIGGVAGPTGPTASVQAYSISRNAW